MAGCVISRKQRQIKSAARSGRFILPIHFRADSRRSADAADFFLNCYLRNHLNLRETILHTVTVRFIRSA